MGGLRGRKDRGQLRGNGRGPEQGEGATPRRGGRRGGDRRGSRAPSPGLLFIVLLRQRGRAGSSRYNRRDHAQALRFYRCFDRARRGGRIPYQGSRMLEHAVRRARFENGKTIFMSATPSRRLMEDSRNGRILTARISAVPRPSASRAGGGGHRADFERDDIQRQGGASSRPAGCREGKPCGMAQAFRVRTQESGGGVRVEDDLGRSRKHRRA